VPEKRGQDLNVPEKRGQDLNVPEKRGQDLNVPEKRQGVGKANQDHLALKIWEAKKKKTHTHTELQPMKHRIRKAPDC
jgi:hypothetical protein